MSRYSEGDYDPEFPNQYQLMQANHERALKGKRGRKLLADLRDALMALPEKRLIEGAMCTVAADRRDDLKPQPLEINGRRNYFADDHNEAVEEVLSQGPGVCAIGAYLWHREVKAGVEPEQAFAQLPTLLGTCDNDALNDTASQAQAVGVVYSLAWDLAYRNDELLQGCTPEVRHERFIAWIDAELAS